MVQDEEYIRFRRVKEYGRICATALGQASRTETRRDLKQARRFNAVQQWHRDHALFFIHIPKTAGTSVRSAIGTPFDPDYPHIKANSFRTIDRELFDSAYSFAVIRHPIERFLSAYSHIHTRTLEGHDPILGLAPSVLNWPIFLEQFEKSWWYRSIIFSALHFQPQWMFVCTPTGQQIVRRLFAFEDMSTIMRGEVSQRLNKEVQIPSFNPSTRKEDGYELSDKAKKLILSHYAKDLELYENARSLKKNGR